MSQFLLRRQGLHWDGVPLPGLSLAECGSTALGWFRSRTAKSGRVDERVLDDGDAALLDSLLLVEGEYLKRAAALLFGSKPERFVPGAYVKIGFFITDDDLRYQDEIHGDLFSQVEKTLEILIAKYLKAFISYQGVQRLETFLFPMAALREAVLNAVVHKDYSSGIPIQISVYAHQIVIWNPGQLPERWTLENLMGKHPSNPFNPLLASAFFRAGYIESWGRGIEKIRRECTAHDMPLPLFDTGMAGLMLTFKANPAHLAATSAYPIVETTPITTPSPDTVHLLSLISANPGISQAELAGALGLSRDGIKYHINKLKKAGTLRHTGPARGGRWEILGFAI